MRKVAILGTAPNSRMFAPFDDQEWEIWACSAGNRRAFSRVTRWYEIHGIVDIKGPENADWNKDYFDWLNTQSFPVYMQEPNDLCPQARVFPMRSLLKKFGQKLRINATSSVAWMIAHAVYEGVDEIGIWGVDMADVSEAYSSQKSGCLNLLEMANSQYGVKITIPLESCLASPPPLYGYAEASRMGRRLLVRKLSLKNEVEKAQQQMNHWERMLHTYRGMLEDVEYVLRTFVDGEHDAELDVEDTEVEVSGHKAVVVTAKGAEVYTTAAPSRAAVTRVPNGLDPQSVEVEKVGSILVPKSHADERRAEE